MFKNLVSNIEGSPQQGIFALPKVKMAENKFGKTWKQKKVLQKTFPFLAYTSIYKLRITLTSYRVEIRYNPKSTLCDTFVVLHIYVPL